MAWRSLANNSRRKLRRCLHTTRIIPSPIFPRRPAHSSPRFHHQVKTFPNKPMLSTKFFGPLILFISFCAMDFSALADSIQVSGITAPLNDVDLGFADAGIIHSEFFHEGDAVKKGDVILE